jgi:hypothetical protein
MLPVIVSLTDLTNLDVFVMLPVIVSLTDLTNLDVFVMLPVTVSLIDLTKLDVLVILPEVIDDTLTDLISFLLNIALIEDDTDVIFCVSLTKGDVITTVVDNNLLIARWMVDEAVVVTAGSALLSHLLILPVVGVIDVLIVIVFLAITGLSVIDGVIGLLSVLITKGDEDTDAVNVIVNALPFALNSNNKLIYLLPIMVMCNQSGMQHLN